MTVEDIEQEVANLDPQQWLAQIPQRGYGTILADPPWRFANRGIRPAPEHRQTFHYQTLPLAAICAMPIGQIAAAQSHVYLWIPMALIQEGLQVLSAWGFAYKTMLIWEKIRKDGQPHGGGTGWYFRCCTEAVLFGTRGRLRTLAPGRRQVNLLREPKRDHSRKPEGLYPVIEACSPSPRLELFGRGVARKGWDVWGNEIETAARAAADV